MKRKYVLVVIAMFALLGACSSAPTVDQQIADVSPGEAAGIIQDNAGNSDFAILDIRTAEEFAAGKIEGSVNIDFYADDFREQLDALDKATHYLVYCNSGNRSGQALSDFEDLGFARVDNLDTGISGWYGEGYPVVP